MTPEDDHYWMQQALKQAEKARDAEEVPVGAVLVSSEGILLASAFNQPIKRHDPTAHAEILCLRHAAEVIQNYRLLNTTLYVTLEPCAMCAGALIHARIQRLVFAAFDPRAGSVASVTKLLDHPAFNHRVTWQGGILEAPAATLLKDFFQVRR